MRRTIETIQEHGPIYIGLDMALTAAGYAVIAGDHTLTSGTWKPPKDCMGIPRLCWFEATLTQFLRHWRPTMVGVEDYAFGQGNRAHQIGELGGLVRMTLARSGFASYTVPIGANKKHASGKGNTPKSQMMLAAFKKWGYTAQNDNDADAYCLARFLQAVANGKADGKGLVLLGVV